MHTYCLQPVVERDVSMAQTQSRVGPRLDSPRDYNPETVTKTRSTHPQRYGAFGLAGLLTVTMFRVKVVALLPNFAKSADEVPLFVPPATTFAVGRCRPPVDRLRLGTRRPSSAGAFALRFWDPLPRIASWFDTAPTATDSPAPVGGGC